jgi:hypothetical protein
MRTLGRNGGLFAGTGKYAVRRSTEPNPRQKTRIAGVERDDADYNSGVYGRSTISNPPSSILSLDAPQYLLML